MKIAVAVTMPDHMEADENVREVMDRLKAGGFVIADYEMNKNPQVSTRVFCHAIIDARHPILREGLDDGTH